MAGLSVNPNERYRLPFSMNVEKVTKKENK